MEVDRSHKEPTYLSLFSQESVDVEACLAALDIMAGIILIQRL